MVTKGLRKNLEATPGEHSIDSLQKTAVLWTSHIIRKVLQSESLSLGGGDHCWFKRRSVGKKRPVIRDNNNNIIIIIIIFNTGYEENIIRTNISHLLYVNNLKLLGKTEEDLRKHLQTTKAVSGDIYTEFVLNSCADIVLKKVKLFPSTNLITDIVRDTRTTTWTGENMQVLRDWEKWRHATWTNGRKVEKGPHRLVKNILISEMNAKDKIMVVGTLVVWMLRSVRGREA